MRALLGPDVEISYAADWTEYANLRPDDGSGDVLFHLDPLWADPNVDFVGVDWYAPMGDWRDGEDHLDAQTYRSPTDPDYLASQVEGGEGYDWYYLNEVDRNAQVRTPIVDTAHGEDWIFRVKDIRNWWLNAHRDRPGGERSAASTDWQPQMKPVRLIEIGCPAVDLGANQPNVFYDPKSSESAFPHHSTGARDDTIQRAALIEHWIASEAAEPSPVSGTDHYIWCWDARPYPFFPALTQVWSDGANWAYGHWLNGRMAFAGLGDVLIEIADTIGVSLQIDGVDQIVDGFAIDRPMSVRDAIEPLLKGFGLNTLERQGGLAVVDPTASLPVTFEPSRITAGESGNPDRNRAVSLMEKHPGRFDLGFIDAGAAYQTGRVTLWDSTGDPALATEASLPLVMSTKQAQRYLELFRDQLDGKRHRQHISVPFSDVAIEAGDILALEDGERFQVRSVSDGLVRSLDLADFRQNRIPIVSTTDTPLPPIAPKAGVPELIIIDAPADPDNGDDIRPLIAVSTTPWTAPVDVSAGADIASLTLRTVVTQPAAIGPLVSNLPAGLADRWDYGSVISVAFDDAQLASVSALAALEDAALIAVETDDGWEFLAFQQAELQFDGSYELTCLLRGRRGTEAAMRSGADAGARCVVIDDAVVRADFGANERGLQRLWRAEAREAGAPARTVETTINGIAFRPLRPGHVRSQRNANGDAQITWTRRTRWGGDSWADHNVPLQEAAEQYELVFKRNGEVLRTETTLAPSFTYSLSDQLADGVPGEVVTVYVAQVSARVGPGEATTIDITL